MEALLNPNVSGVRVRRPVRTISLRVRTVEPRVEVVEPAVEAGSAKPFGVHQLRAPMSRVVQRPSTVAREMPWWISMVVLPTVAVVAAMVSLA